MIFFLSEIVEYYLIQVFFVCTELKFLIGPPMRISTQRILPAALKIWLAAAVSGNFPDSSI